MLIARTGYFNPTLAYGEQRAIEDARKAGANGFIMVDLPPEEAIKFRELCTSEGFVVSSSNMRRVCLLSVRNRLSYVPLIAPSTTDARIKFLGGIADSFIYVVSKVFS